MSDRTDEEIQWLSEEAFRHEMRPETERLRMLQEALEEIRLACYKLADPYDQLANGQWAQQGVALSALVENVVADLLGARAKIRRLEIQLARLKGGDQ